jgi:uncharacterized metal-binding protein
MSNENTGTSCGCEAKNKLIFACGGGADVVGGSYQATQLPVDVLTIEFDWNMDAVR